MEKSVQDLLAEAKKQIEKIKPDEKFLVRDLFYGYEWNRIKKGTKIRLGAFFYEHVLNEKNDLIIPIEKTKQNQQVYKKNNFSKQILKEI